MLSQSGLSRYLCLSFVFCERTPELVSARGGREGGKGRAFGLNHDSIVCMSWHGEKNFFFSRDAVKRPLTPLVLCPQFKA